MFSLFAGRAKTFKNKLFLLKFVSKEKPGPSRFCFSVSKKIAKNAVARNKMRRAGYRLLEEYLPQLPANILAFFSYRAMPGNSEEIGENIKSVLIDSKLIKK